VLQEAISYAAVGEHALRTFAEEAIAVARYEIIDEVSDKAWNYD